MFNAILNPLNNEMQYNTYINRYIQTILNFLNFIDSINETNKYSDNV